MKKSKVSVLLANYNGKQYLQKLLPILTQQTYSSYEIILVDNNSDDGSVEYVQKKHPLITVIQNKENTGFAIANNQAAAKANGDILILLNTDTSIKKTYIADCVAALQSHPECDIFQTSICQLAHPELLDSAGSFWTNSTFLYHYGFGKERINQLYAKPYRVFSALGASLVIKAEVVHSIGLFDSDFWSYYEETDFCHRAWLAGYSVWHIPHARVLHAKGGTALKLPSELLLYHNTKNKLCSYLKNFEILRLGYILPVALILNLGLALYYSFQKKFTAATAIFRGIAWNAAHFQQTIQKRRHIQQLRTVNDGTYLSYTKVNPRLEYYKRLFTGLEAYVD